MQQWLNGSCVSKQVAKQQSAAFPVLSGQPMQHMLISHFPLLAGYWLQLAFDLCFDLLHGRVSGKYHC